MAVYGLLAKKLGMVQVIRPDGRVAGCTVLEAGPCVVTQVKRRDRDGYEAVQLGFERVPAHRLSQAERGHLAARPPLRHLAEFPADPADYDSLALGQTITVADLFTVGDRVDVAGVSKGKGFAGVMRRHGFHGGPRTHGQSDRARSPGAVSSGTTPGRVLRGTRMAGRLGGKQQSAINLEVVAIQPERHLIFLNGAVPGADQGLVRLRQTKRTP